MRALPHITIPVLLALSAGIYAGDSFFRESPLSGRIPASLRAKYPQPILEQDDALFDRDSTGVSKFANVMCNDTSCVVFVVDPKTKGDSTLAWVSGPCIGHLQSFFIEDLNHDGKEEFALLTNVGFGVKRPVQRLYIWRWEDSTATLLRPCGDTTKESLETETLFSFEDVDGDGSKEIIARQIVSGGIARNGSASQLADTYRWNGSAYCLKR